MLQHLARRDRPSTKSPAGQAGAGEAELVRGRAIDGPLRADLVTISVGQSVPQERHRREQYMWHGTTHQYIRARERDQHLEGHLQSSGCH